MCAAVGKCFSSIIDTVDRAMIRLNRRTPCVRKTIALASLTFLPLLVSTGITMTYVFSLPSDIRALAGITCTAIPFLFSSITLWVRYGWLVNAKVGIPLPKKIEPLLKAEVDNQELLEEHRDRCKALVEASENYVAPPPIAGEFI